METTFASWARFPRAAAIVPTSGRGMSRAGPARRAAKRTSASSFKVGLVWFGCLICCCLSCRESNRGSPIGWSIAGGQSQCGEPLLRER